MAFGRAERVAGFKVSARKIGPRERTAISGLISSGRLEKSNACTIVLFHKDNGEVTATQRCKGRKLHGHNTRQCRGGKGQFVRCGGRRR